MGPNEQKQLVRIAEKVAHFESGPSERGLPAGAHRGGGDFETVVRDCWGDFVVALGSGVVADNFQMNGRTYTALTSSDGRRVMYFGRQIQASNILKTLAHREIPEAWLEVKFRVKDLLRDHLGESVYDFAPPTAHDSPKYHGKNYLKIVEGRTTNFDETIALTEDGVLVEKMLFEYKSAKSSSGNAVDGNAHERLSFQALQYLEVAQRYTRASFNVLASSAFAKYKNKYQPAFNQQAVRLGDAFAFFIMRYLSCESEYKMIYTALADFILKGTRVPGRLR